MKKIKVSKVLQLIFMLSIVALVLCGNAMDVSAQETEIVRFSGTWGDLSWKMTTDTLTITGSGEMPEAEDQRYPWNVRYGDDVVTKIVIGEGVTNIASGAFYCDYDVQTVTISASVKTIGAGAFGKCDDLETVTFASGSKLETLGRGAFNECTSLEQITLPESVTTIGESCFNYCANLKTITIGNNVTVIDEDAFSRCSSLSSISLPDTLQTIGDGAFSYCTGLTSVTIPSGVKELGNSAFYGCSGLDGKIVIPKSVETIGQNTFTDCTGIDEVEYYATVTVPNNMFGRCISLKKVILGSGVPGVQQYPFRGCELETYINYSTDTIYDHSNYSYEGGNFKESVSDDFTMYGYFGSTTEEHADKCGFNFKAFAPSLKKLSNASGGVKVEWNASPGATSYNVYRSTTKASGYSLIKSGVTSTSYIDTSATSAKTYYYKIVACKDAKKSLASKATDGITYMAAPTFKKVVNVVSGVHVYWNKASGATSYNVWRSTSKTGEYTLVKSGVTATHYIDTTAVSGTTYYYKIVARRGSAKSHSSLPSGAITYVGTPDITSRFNKGAGVQLGWNKISGATGYAIYRKPYTGSTWTRVATIQGNTTFTWMDESVKTNNGTVYKYTIRALAGSDMKTLSGCRSTGRTMARLNSRTLSSAAKTSATSIKCNWTTTSVCNGYEVRFMVGDTVYKTFTVGNYKTGVKTFTGLKAGQTYKIQVRSYKKVEGVGTFYSAWSTAKTVSL